MSEENIKQLSIIGERYAGALFAIAENSDRLDEIGGELNEIENLIMFNSDFNMFLNHPKFSHKEKKEILDDIFKDNISNIVLNFLKILLDKNRIVVFKSINNSYKKILAEKRRILTANITTAIEMDYDVRAKLRAKLESIYNKEIEFNYSTDNQIIAGMVIEIGDKTIDGSLKTKLENMKKQIVQG